MVNSHENHLQITGQMFVIIHRNNDRIRPADTTKYERTRTIQPELFTYKPPCLLMHHNEA